MNVTGHLRAKRGVWHTVIRYYDAAGQQREMSETTGLPEKGNKRKAQAILAERMKQLEGQYETALSAKNVAFLSFMRDWLNDVMVHQVREATFTQYHYVYDSYISKYKPFHGVKLPNVTPALLQSFYNQELKDGLSPNTVRKHHANIHKCLAYALRMGFIPATPPT